MNVYSSGFWGLFLLGVLLFWLLAGILAYAYQEVRKAGRADIVRYLATKTGKGNLANFDRLSQQQAEELIGEILGMSKSDAPTGKTDD